MERHPRLELKPDARTFLMLVGPDVLGDPLELPLLRLLHGQGEGEVCTHRQTTISRSETLQKHARGLERHDN